LEWGEIGKHNCEADSDSGILRVTISGRNGTEAGVEVLLPDRLKAAEITRSAAPFKSVKAVKKRE